MKKLLINLFFLACAIYGHAQATYHGNLSNTMDLKACDTLKVYTFEIKNGMKEIKLSAKSYLSAGDLSFIVFDPEGKREAGFNIGAGSDGKPGNGRMTHEIKPPISGIWKIQLKTTNATGSFNYTLNYN